MHLFDVFFVGAGPAVRATAIAASRRGLEYEVIEKGALVNSLLHYPAGMVFFTAPELMEIGGMPFVSPYEKPTRVEALRYYRRVCDALKIDVVFEETVVAIAHEAGVPDSRGSFAVDTHSSRGIRRSARARTVVIATGAYDIPNHLGVRGEDLPHVSHYFTQPHAFFRKRVVVVGGRNSAAEAALELFRAGAHVTLVHRRSGLAHSIKYWLKPELDHRIKEGAILARFDTTVVEIRPTAVVVDQLGRRDQIEADAVFLLTGYTSDDALLRSAGVEIDPDTDGPVFDPNTFETNVPGLYVAGAVVAGRQSGKIFIENGRFHGEQAIEGVVKHLRALESIQPQ